MPLSRRFRPQMLLLALLAGSAMAASSPVTLTTKTTAAVANSCIILTADNLSFGAYSPISGLDATTTGQLRLNCTKGAAFTVVPTSGGNALVGSGGSLGYGLYIDSGMTKQWGTPHSSSTAAFNSNQKYQAGDGTGVLALFQTQLTAAQFAANPAYASQPYGVVNTSPNVYTYYVNYYAQPTGPGDLGTLAAQYPNSRYINVAGGVRLGDPGTLPTVVNGPGIFVLPANTPKAGTIYQVSSGFVDSASLTGTAASSLSPTLLTYYGKVPKSQDMAAGTYTDTVVFTVTF